MKRAETLFSVSELCNGQSWSKLSEMVELDDEPVERASAGLAHPVDEAEVVNATATEKIESSCVDVVSAVDAL